MMALLEVETLGVRRCGAITGRVDRSNKRSKCERERERAKEGERERESRKQNHCS